MGVVFAWAVAVTIAFGFLFSPVVMRFTANVGLAQSIPTISPWGYFGGGTTNVRLSTSTTKVLIGARATTTDSYLETPSLSVILLPSLPCLGTNASGTLQAGTCGGGGGASIGQTFQVGGVSPNRYLISTTSSDSLVMNGSSTLNGGYYAPFGTTTNGSSTNYFAQNLVFTSGTGTVLKVATIKDNSSSAGTNGQLLFSNGSVDTWSPTSTIGSMLSLNGISGLSQTLATTSNLGGYGFSSAGTVHTLNIPIAASTTDSGLISAANFKIFMEKVASTSIDTSAEIAALVTDETGSGALVFGTGPTITLANGTGLPVATGISGLGTGIATWLATPSSANLATALTDETGTAGSVVFSASPTFTGTAIFANLLAASATIPVFNSSTTLATNLTFINGTGTNATTTAMVMTNGTTTNFRVQNDSFGNATGTALVITNGTSTNLLASALTWANATGTALSLTNGSSTNWFTNNLTFNNATGTSLVFTNATGTNIFGQNHTWANATGTFTIATNISSTYATNTNLVFTNGTGTSLSLTRSTSTDFSATTVCIGGDCRQAWPAGGASFGKSWEVFPGGIGSLNYLAPTTTTMGINVTASSTIGNGTNNGGLVINGSATTTGTSTVNKLVVGQFTANLALQTIAGIVDSPAMINASSSGRSGMILQNTGTGPLSEFRFIVADPVNTSEYLGFGLTSQNATAGGTLANLSKNRLSYIVSNSGRDFLLSSGSGGVGGSIYLTTNASNNPTFKVDFQQGYVGLGLAATSTIPTSLLTVNGGAEFILSTSTNSTTTNVGFIQNFRWANATGTAFVTTNGTTTNWFGQNDTWANATGTFTVATNISSTYATDTNFVATNGTSTSFSMTRATSTDFAIGNMSAGSVLFASTSGSIEQDNAGFFYNNQLHRLGIGTTTPNWPLSIASTAPFIAITDTNAATNRKHWLISSSDGNLYMGTSTDLFATSSPAFTLSDGSGLTVGPNTASSTATGLVVNGTVFMYGRTVSTAGNAVCHLSATNEDIDAGGTTCVTSTERNKIDIDNLAPGTWKELLKLDVKDFNYKPEYADPIRDAGGKRLGIIAEQMQKIDPRLVQFNDKKEPISVHFDGLIALLIQAVQEQGQTTKRSVEENWQWALMLLLGAGLIYQQRQINRLKK